MTDVPTLTHQATLAARIWSLSQSVATGLFNLPKNEQEARLAMIHDHYAGKLKKVGMDNEHGRRWLDLQIKFIRLLISDIEVSGDKGGNDKATTIPSFVNP